MSSTADTAPLQTSHENLKNQQYVGMIREVQPGGSLLASHSADLGSSPGTSCLLDRQPDMCESVLMLVN